VFAQDVGRSDVERLRSVPGVEGVGYARQLALVRPDGQFLAVGGPLDDSLFRDVDRLRIVAGRTPSIDAPDEVVIGEALAQKAHLGVGDIVPVKSYAPSQVAASQNGAELSPPAGPNVQLRVVGISRAPIDLGLQGSEGGVLLLSRAFVEKYGAEIGNFSGPRGGVLLVRLRDGEAGVDRFLGQLRHVLGGRPFNVDPTALTIGGVQESINVLAIGVLVFGVIAGFAALIALGLIISRQVALVADGQAALRDLGMARRLRATAIAGPIVFAIGVGALGAVIGAWGASALSPFGLARRAEPHPGLSFDGLALVGGALAIMTLLGAVALAAAALLTSESGEDEGTRRRPSVLARALEACNLRPAGTIGVGMALHPGRGRDAVPVRSSIAGVAVAVLGIAAVAVFAGSLDKLVDTPRAYGTSWDAHATETRAGLDSQPCGGDKSRLTRATGVDALARACSLSITLDDRAVGAIGLTSLRGSIQPTVLEGSAPRGPHEVALGSDTLHALGKRIGDRVTGESPKGRVTYRIVGRAVLPSPAEAQAIADGAVFTGGGLARLYDPDDVSGSSTLVVRFAPGVDKLGATQRIDRLDGVDAEPAAVPLEVERVHQIDHLPIALAAFLAILGAIAFAHLLVTCVQRRRHEFAVLKTLGFRRSQFSATLAVEATTVAGVGLALGLLPGAAAGAALWRATAETVGVLPEVAVPVIALAGTALATVVIANVIAAFPARSAARTQPAAVLRSE
jgi:hypothetical protein